MQRSHKRNTKATKRSQTSDGTLQLQPPNKAHMMCASEAKYLSKGVQTALLIEENPAHHLRLVVYPIIYKVFLHAWWCRISSINRIIPKFQSKKTPRRPTLTWDSLHFLDRSKLSQMQLPVHLARCSSVWLSGLVIFYKWDTSDQSWIAWHKFESGNLKPGQGNYNYDLEQSTTSFQKMSKKCPLLSYPWQ